MSVIANKSKAESRKELDAAVQAFLDAGGQIEVVEPKKMKVKRTVGSKTTRGGRNYSGAVGFPTKSAFVGRA